MSMHATTPARQMPGSPFMDAAATGPGAAGPAPYWTAPVALFDTGERCERHVGELYPPRCIDCDAPGKSTAPSYAPLNRYGECTKHPNYPGPWCDACKRDAAGL